MADQMEKSEILELCHKYDEEHPWWVEKEKEIGDKLRETGELTKEDLIGIVEWKFKTLPDRMKLILGYVRQNEDDSIRRISRLVLGLSLEYDAHKVESLRCIRGVGPAVASTILTFYDPKNYGVFDIHVWRELFGKETQPLFTTRNCLTLLSKLRELAEKHHLDVRTVEKALFKKNLHRSYAGTPATKDATQTFTGCQGKSRTKRGHAYHHSIKYRIRWSTISSTLVPRFAQLLLQKTPKNSTTRRRAQ